MERESDSKELDEMMKKKLNLEDKDAKKDENDSQESIKYNSQFAIVDHSESRIPSFNEFLRGRVVIESFLLRIQQTFNDRS